MTALEQQLEEQKRTNGELRDQLSMMLSQNDLSVLLQFGGVDEATFHETLCALQENWHTEIGERRLNAEQTRQEADEAYTLAQREADKARAEVLRIAEEAYTHAMQRAENAYMQSAVQASNEERQADELASQHRTLSAITAKFAANN